MANMMLILYFENSTFNVIMNSFYELVKSDHRKWTREYLCNKYWLLGFFKTNVLCMCVELHITSEYIQDMPKTEPFNNLQFFAIHISIYQNVQSFICHVTTFKYSLHKFGESLLHGKNIIFNLSYDVQLLFTFPSNSQSTLTTSMC